MFGGFASSLVGAAGSLLGGTFDAHYSRENTRAAQAFQREVLQNQLQWRAADAKKAGLHPLAALGTSAASGAVGTAGIGSTFASALGRLGEGIGDGFYAYMTKGERAAAARAEVEKKNKMEHQQDVMFTKQAALLDAQVAETLARAKSYTTPVATGKEVMPGQVDSPSMFGEKILPLFNIARIGNGYMVMLNPDIADSVSESMIDTNIARLMREDGLHDPQVIDEFISYLPKDIQRRINRGEMRLSSVHGTGAIKIVPVGPGEEFDRYNLF